MKKTEKNVYGIASFVLGIVTFLMLWFPILPVITGILGIVYSRKQLKINSNGLNTAGFIISIIGLCIASLILLFQIGFGVILAAIGSLEG